MISIIIPLYNAEQYIAETLESVLSQTYSDWECIVVDDGSTDNSANIVTEYTKRDSRFSYFKQENGGPSKARNYGLSLSKGEYIQFLDADDVLLPERFDVLIQEYAKLGNNFILYSNLEVGNSRNIYDTQKFGQRISMGYDIYFKDMYTHFLKDFLFIPGCALFPVAVIKNTQWDPSIKHSEDWEFYLHVLCSNKSASFRYVPQVLFYYRNTEQSLSKNLSSVYAASYVVLEKYFSIENFWGYIKTTSKLFSRNLLKYIFSKDVHRIVFPISPKNHRSYGLFLCFPIICMLSIYYFIKALI